MKNYTELVKSLARTDVVHINENTSKDDLLAAKIQEKGAEETEHIIELLSSALRKDIANFIEKLLSLNITNQGIIIRGKTENVAFSHYGVRALMSCKGDIKKAGRLSAYQFSDDFRKVSQLNGVQEIPSNECAFMNRLAEFDKISAWYKGEVEISEGGSINDSYISIIAPNPFTASPNTGYFSHCSNNEYLQGYYLSLFNACSDLLRVTFDAQGKKNDRLFAVSINETDEAHPTKCFFQVKYVKRTITEWDQINKIIYYIVVQLNTVGIDRTDIFEMLESFNDLKDLILSNFRQDISTLSVSVLGDITFIDLLDKVRKAPGDIEINRYVLHSLLNEIRVRYEDYRISKLG
jgi:hypothetical protein